MTSGMALGQNPSVVNNTRNAVKPVQASAASAQAAPAKPAAAVAPKVHSTSSGKSAPAVKPAASTAASKPASKATQKPAPAKTAAKKSAKKVERVEVESTKNPLDKGGKKEVSKTINLTGRRDPFVSPVVARTMTGSGCSTGKRCLAVDQISLKGVVKSDTGMIAVVVNAINKAYFLRENDPVFNGYVVKITGDSIIFKETMQDRMGKSFTREVTKKIMTPAV
jgi:hypothetical protein